MPGRILRAGEGPVSWASVPNLITIARILLTVPFLWLLLADGGADGVLRWIAGALFVFSIATDWIDGWLARRNNLVTELGKLLDPIADKILVGAALVGLSILGELPWWVTAVILVREIGITVYRFIVISDGVIAAAWSGKIKTFLQSVAVSLALLPFWVLLGDWVHGVNLVLMTLAVLATVYSGIEYVVQAILAHRRKRLTGQGTP